MIFARDKAQLCNNLLQFAHVYAWAREHGRSVVSMRFSYKYRYFKIRRTRYANFLLYLFAKYAAALKLLPTANFKRDTCDPAALERIMERRKNIVVSGWFVRFYDLFIKYRAEICDLFTVDARIADHVREQMRSAEATDARTDIVRLGIHIRRGDYATWSDGKFFYDDKVYAAHIDKFAEMFPGKIVHAYISTNDPNVSANGMQSLTNNNRLRLHLFGGNAPSDLFMLSECDYVIGPPSTFSLVAVMYRDIPLYRIDTPDPSLFTIDGFMDFNYWFRRIN